MKNHKKVILRRTNTIIWFRRDFRLDNNPALDFAISGGGQIIALYIEYNHIKDGWAQGEASRWWCHHSLERLSDSLAAQGIQLRYFRGDPSKILPAVVKETSSTAVCWNRLYEPEEIKMEVRVRTALADTEYKCFDSHLLFTPGTILNQQAKPYRVFTPFWKKARRQLEVTGVTLCAPKKNKGHLNNKKRLTNECSLSDLGLLGEQIWHTKFHRHWEPGEDIARKKVNSFIKQAIEHYETNRDIPSIKGTSKLSPHLHFGEITPAQIVYQLISKDLFYKGSTSVERFLAELGWREFAHHVLWHSPESTNQAMYEKFRKFWPAKVNQKYLKAWQTGQTGIPIIDAGMRELSETGWMHNRVRMVVGSFLTKNLGIHWLHGAKWFWDTLLDANLANNTMGWQWVAGCGVDAAPYYRIFNPYTQAKKFDKELRYIRYWVAELEEFKTTPIIKLQQSRVRALEKYAKLRSN